MALYDIIDDIAGKQLMKTETGDNRIFGVMTGIVAKNYDQGMPGRICVTIPVRDENANELKWARIASPSAGKKWGHFFVPEVGDQVLLAFEQGNIEKPYVIGCIPKDDSSFVKQAGDEDNKYKKITTKNGSSITFVDAPEGDGDNDKITIETAGKKHSLLLDNERKKIVLSDKDGSNKVEMKTEDGSINIECEKTLTIKVGSSITLKMNGNNGAVQLECSKLTMKASNSAYIEGSSNTRIKGTNLNLEAASMLKAESSAMVNISGNPIKLG